MTNQKLTASIPLAILTDPATLEKFLRHNEVLLRQLGERTQCNEATALDSAEETVHNLLRIYPGNCVTGQILRVILTLLPRKKCDDSTPPIKTMLSSTPIIKTVLAALSRRYGHKSLTVGEMRTIIDLCSDVEDVYISSTNC